MTESQLKPIEKLYLVSKENPLVYDKKNKLYCLAYRLVENKNVKAKNFQFNGKSSNTEYENLILGNLIAKKYLDNDKIISDLVFNKTLINQGYMNAHIVKKKFLFFNIAKDEIKKTSKYFEFQNEVTKQFENGVSILDIVCPNLDLKKETVRVYNMIKLDMMNAKIKQDEEKAHKEKKDLKDAMGAIAGKNE